MNRKPYPSPSEIVRMDDDLASKGVPIHQRATQAHLKWMSTPPFVDGVVDFAAEGRWFDDQWKELHPSAIVEAEPFMFLAVSARGVSYRYDPPMIFGAPTINPMDFIKFTAAESERLFKKDPKAWWELYYQAIDCLDLFLNRLDLPTNSALAIRLKMVACGQLEATARQMVASAHDASLPQATSLIAEMAIKAALACKGLDDRAIEKFGHHLRKSATKLNELCPSVLDNEFLEAASSLDGYVQSRYDPPMLKPEEAQARYGRALFVASEALRRVGHHRLGHRFATDPATPKRWT
ncbi:hypothetical protein [Brevundimonas fontaquae]|uniref:HEPN domain-containing protein n=1 Tax=Brevundimonas fontaquae TaxID=2813778 RepID=A0ABX7LJE6_9CAUL|nr:hypothetical protein [Brevundimonas fontaquae]QSF52984.1 hypothetical protein JX001_09050 [Brevundimonas fontaquae]